MFTVFLISGGVLGAQLYFGVTFFVDRGGSWVVPRTSARVIHRIDEPELFWSVIVRQLLLFGGFALLSLLKLPFLNSPPAAPWTP